MINKLTKKYKDLLSFFHNFGVKPASPIETELDQATLRTGHNITYSQVRADVIPACSNKAELKYKILEYDFNNGRADIKKLKIGKGFASIIQYHDKDKLKPVDETYYSWFLPINGEITDIQFNEDNNREIVNINASEIYASDFIAPTDVLVGRKIFI